MNTYYAAKGSDTRHSDFSIAVNCSKVVQCSVHTRCRKFVCQSVLCAIKKTMFELHYRLVFFIPFIFGKRNVYNLRWFTQYSHDKKSSKGAHNAAFLSINAQAIRQY